MADYFYGINRGAGDMNEDAITQGASTGSTELEVRISTTPAWSRQEVCDKLDAIKRRILSGENAAGFPGL